MNTHKVFLLPGEMCVSKDQVEISTILGSCVGVCLFNRRAGFGGMNHFMLPSTPAGVVASGKHGDYATELLIKMMKDHDAQTNNLEALVLGGGNVTSHLSAGTGIGANNIVMARNILDKHNIRITGKNVGGDHGRKIWYKNWTGEIEVRKIEKSTDTQMLATRKADLSKRKIKVLVVDDSELVRKIIIEAISDDPHIEVVGSAANPYEAREMLLESDPDVLCLDIIMPRMDGITFLKKIFQYMPKPVIIISTVAQKGSKLREEAQRVGAVDIIDKEELRLYEGIAAVRSVLVPKIKNAAASLVHKKTKEEIGAL